MANKIIFLGVAERAAAVSDGIPEIVKWNIIGLKHHILTYFLPISLTGVIFGFAINTDGIAEIPKIEIVHENGKKVGTFEFQSTTIKSDTLNNQTSAQEEAEQQFIGLKSNTWSTIFLPFKSPLLIEEPGRIFFQHSSDGKRIGELLILPLTPQPLTPERIEAIKANPNAIQYVGLTFGCQQCSSTYTIYSGLERNPKVEMKGEVWSSDANEKFQCECGKTNLNLELCKKNLHGLLGENSFNSLGTACIPLYEASALRNLNLAFTALLKEATKEEQLQVFLSSNKILFHPFSPVKLFTKPKILTDYVADFAILTPQRELILVELEKPNTRILKKDGGIHSEISHAFDQVQDWLHQVKEHRITILDTLKLEKSKVSSIKGLVIAGRDADYASENLRKFKGRDNGEIKFLTYDDLQGSLTSLIKQMENL